MNVWNVEGLPERQAPLRKEIADLVSLQEVARTADYDRLAEVGPGTAKLASETCFDGAIDDDLDHRRSRLGAESLMNVDQADPSDLAALREAFDLNVCGPPLGWDALREFETAHKIVLPEPYRTCVAEICDEYAQGPPGYGLVPLAGLPDHWEDDRTQSGLAEPFPLTQAWMWENDEGDTRSAEEIDAAIDQVHGHGSIILGTDGCAMNWHLIVTGPHRGHIWNICGEGAQPFGAEFGFTTGTSGFAGWVRHWAAHKWWWDAG